MGLSSTGSNTVSLRGTGGCLWLCAGQARERLSHRIVTAARTMAGLRALLALTLTAAAAAGGMHYKVGNRRRHPALPPHPNKPPVREPLSHPFFDAPSPRTRPSPCDPSGPRLIGGARF